MRREEVFLMVLLIFAETFIFIISPASIDLFWLMQGSLAGFIFIFEVLTGRIHVTREFTPLLSGVLLMVLGSLLILMKMNFIIGLLGFLLDITGLILFFYGIFYARKVYAGKVKANLTALSNTALKSNISETPKSFLKKCVGCGREIPIASEKCPRCGQKQP